MVIAKNFLITEYARPFVKWAGGKGQLLNTLERYYPLKLLQGEIKRYIEPFVGGGAVLFNILQKFNIEEAYIFDINVDLINAYKVIKFNVDELVYYLKSLEIL
ncbi:DNA adenine methylase [Carboxydothermus ferrireducens]|uniref:DNA adenine methylase n=1 Tax=Carboxydothermus ferrireducens DSM 11255 TaxID=1119529 RepID=A0ABX2RBP7_9THEO|nr:DNA adenine methylase [Carboxydothermus ferrireducens]NYE58027.1 DNA adenine methylase [Carboxydothermus ferrireducens DSM 11255]